MKTFTLYYEGKARVTVNHRTVAKRYQVTMDDWATHDTTWLQEKHWFMPGTQVTIQDEQGNTKKYVRE